MTPEQFDALVSLVGAMIRAESSEARNSSDGGLIETQELGEFIREARALLVADPETCNHDFGGQRNNVYENCLKCGYCARKEPAKEIENPSSGCDLCDGGVSVSTAWGGRKHVFGTIKSGQHFTDCTAK